MTQPYDNDTLDALLAMYTDNPEDFMPKGLAYERRTRVRRWLAEHPNPGTAANRDRASEQRGQR